MSATVRHKKRWPKIVGWIVAIIVLLDLVGGAIFFQISFVRSHKSFIHQHPIRRTDRLYRQEIWFRDAHKQQWVMRAANGQDRLVADYIPAAHHTEKTALICHGFMNRKETMGAYAAMFHRMGYNVLIPDARAHGQSTGKLIGYGWPERHDQRLWIKRIIKHNGKRSRIVMFGVSMGGATTMMTSGLNLPPQVKCFIEDCGYSSVLNELTYEAEARYHLPTFLTVQFETVMSLYNRALNGFFLRQASSTQALHHNYRPMLFIHGSRDDFVPTRMVYQNYHATRGPRELWIVPGAKHASSFQTKPHQYQQHIRAFVNKYVH